MSLLYFTVVFMLILSGSVKRSHAQPPIVLYPRVTPGELVKLLGEYGIAAQIHNDGVIVTRDGEKSYYFFDDDCRSIQFYIGYTMDISLEKINAFNTKYKYVKCIRKLMPDNSTVVALEIDFSMIGGVTKEALFCFFRTIDFGLRVYHELIESENELHS